MSIQAMNPERFNDPKQPFNIGDLGTATGTNSIAPLSSIIERVRDLIPEKPINITLEDINASGLDDAANTVASGLEQHDNVAIKTVGKSFYDSVF